MHVTFDFENVRLVKNYTKIVSKHEIIVYGMLYFK